MALPGVSSEDVQPAETMPTWRETGVFCEFSATNKTTTTDRQTKAVVMFPLRVKIAGNCESGEANH
jgi:hypothetical protein